MLHANGCRCVTCIAAENAPAPVTAQAGALQAVDRESLIDLIEDHLTAVYHCTRVWEAWQVGTMTEDDFTEARGTELAPELADALLSKLAATQPNAAPAAEAMTAEQIAFHYPNGHTAHCAARREAHGHCSCGYEGCALSEPAAEVVAPSDALIRKTISEAQRDWCDWRGNDSEDSFVGRALRKLFAALAAPAAAIAAREQEEARTALVAALNAYGDFCFARGLGEWPNEPDRPKPSHKEHGPLFSAVLDLASRSEAPATRELFCGQEDMHGLAEVTK